MKAQGLDVISFAAGEPDFGTPDPICDAAIEAMRAGATKYTASSGTPELKAAIVEKFRQENGLEFRTDQIVVSCGAKHSVFNSLMVLVEPGDEVILLAPYWMTYADQVILAGGTPVAIPLGPESGFVPSLEQLQAAISARTKAIILNSPCNPTGAVLPRATLKEIAALALRHDFWIVADEIYERLIYDARHDSIAALGAEVRERTVTISGCSKSFAMTGWRIGYAAAPVAVAQAMSNLQDQVTSNPTTFAQAGAIAALRCDASVVDAMRDEFRGRRDLMLSRLREIPGLATPTPQGAFYVFPDVRAFLGERCPTDVDLADYLLSEAHVATVAGSVFEGPGHLRLSYSASRADIERGVDRIAEALERLL